MKQKKNWSKTSERYTYDNTKARCNNRNNDHYHCYGGRGIKFNYSSFEEFFTDVGEKPEPKKEYILERINIDGNYEVGNCRWVYYTERYKNMKRNHTLIHNNQINTVTSWARQCNLPEQLVKTRILKLGWCVDCAIKIEINQKGKERVTCNHKSFINLN